MYVKKIHPIQVLNKYATEFIGIFPVTVKDFGTRQFEIEFYDKDGNPLLSRKYTISGLPVNHKLVENVDPHTFNYTSPEAIEMYDAQDKILFDEIKKGYGLTYYDDTYEKNVERSFSYTRYFNAVNSEDVGKCFSFNV
jgi:hypothetical protein